MMKGPPGSTVVVNQKKKRGKKGPASLQQPQHPQQHQNSQQQGQQKQPQQPVQQQQEKQHQQAEQVTQQRDKRETSYSDGATPKSRGKQSIPDTPPSPGGRRSENSSSDKRTASLPVQPVSLAQLSRSIITESREATPKKGKRSEGAPSSFSHTFDVPPYPRGILNNSNFCFMNAILQSLMVVPGLAQLAISAVDEKERCPTLSALGAWFENYWRPGYSRQAVPPPRLPFTMSGGKTTSGGISGATQEDAQEFVQRLFETVQSELVGLERTVDQSAGSRDAAVADELKGWTFVRGSERVKMRKHVSNESSSVLLDSIFGGTLQSHLKGASPQRNSASVTIERFFCLPVDIGFASSCTVEEAIARTLQTERIDDDSRGKSLCKTLSLDQLPNVLLVQLRRWAVTAEGELVKLHNEVRVTNQLVLPPSVCSSESSRAGRTYQLVSAVAHRGGGSARGHYISFLSHHVANPAKYTAPALGAAAAREPLEDGLLVQCNDAHLSVVPFQTLNRETPYLLVYQKKATP